MLFTVYLQAVNSLKILGGIWKGRSLKILGGTYKPRLAPALLQCVLWPLKLCLCMEKFSYSVLWCSIASNPFKGVDLFLLVSHVLTDVRRFFLLKRAPQNRVIVDLGAIYCQKYIILEQSDWSQAGCLNTANFSHLPGRTGLWKLFPLILSYIFLCQRQRWWYGDLASLISMVAAMSYSNTGCQIEKIFA